MTRLFAILLVVSLVLCMSLPVSVNAQETEQSDYDWENTDWETFEWRNLDVEVEESLANWLRTEADMDTMLLVTTTTGDGAMAEQWAIIIFERFKQDPYAFVQALAKLEDAQITRAANFIAYNGSYTENETAEWFRSLTFPQELSKAEKHALETIIVAVENHLNVELPNPKTSDPIVEVMVVMALCCIGMAVLIERRKNIFGI